MTPEQRAYFKQWRDTHNWNEYNKAMQKKYRRQKGLKRLTTEEIFNSEGHCKICGMRLEASFHILHPCTKR